MIEYKTLLAGACLLLSLDVFACKPPGLDTEVQFAGGASKLSATNIGNLARWNALIIANFQTKGRYLVEIKTAPSLGVSRGLSEQRQTHLRNLLSQFGAEPGQIENRSFAFKGSNSDRVNLAGISFEPACPHPCCPGPEPIEER
ncbi:hypothetical protein CF70_026105 [Cupriavidus sp. SK-3]|nr:hypothetical protein CF70_026105 [Cupriavidus sp. SK-3]